MYILYSEKYTLDKYSCRKRPGATGQPGDSHYSRAPLTALLSKVGPAGLLYLAIGQLPGTTHHTGGSQPVFFQAELKFISIRGREWGKVHMAKKIQIDISATEMNIFVVLVMQGWSITVSGRTLGQQQRNDVQCTRTVSYSVEDVHCTCMKH